MGLSQLISKKPTSKKEKYRQLFKKYHRASLFLIWSAIFNLIAVGIYIFGQSKGISAFDFGYTFLFYIYDFVSRNIGDPTQINLVFALFGVIASLIFGFIGYFSYKGRLIPLIIGSSLYLIDFLVTIILFVQNFEQLVFAFLIHLIIMVNLALALYFYTQIVNMAKELVQENKTIKENTKNDGVNVKKENTTKEKKMKKKKGN